MSEWIDVKDKLPKKDGRYIVHTKNLTGYVDTEDIDNLLKEMVGD